MRELIIYGASDDLVEFDGAFYEEYNIYKATEFDISISSPRGERSFILEAKFTNRGWKLALAFYGGDELDEPDACDPDVCRFDGVTFDHYRKGNDPRITIPIADDETVTVERVGRDPDDEDA